MRIQITKTIFLAIILFGVFGLAKSSLAATEFVSVVDTGSGSGYDYASLSDWEAGVQTDLTSSATQVFSGTRTNSISDNATVYLCRGGVYQTHYGTVVHTTSGQILIESITGSATEASGDVWYTNNTCDSSNYFTIADGGDSAIAVAKCRATTGTADTTAVTIDGWTTSATNYIKIWTDPDENYRHQGKWDIAKYRLESNAYSGVIRNYESYVRIDGLQIAAGGDQTPRGFWQEDLADSNNDIQISNNIIKNTSSAVGNYGIDTGIFAGGDNGNYKIWNNIIYDFNKQSGNNSIGIYAFTYNGIDYIYNNSVTSCSTGIYVRDDFSTNLVKNNIVKGSGNVNAYVGTFSSGTDYNATDGTDDIGQGSNNRVSQTFTFLDETNNDFHLAPTDFGARNRGGNLYSDGALSITEDIDGDPRPNSATTFDIGADEIENHVFYSVGQSSSDMRTCTGSDCNTNPLTFTIASNAATFSVAQTGNIGVGDRVLYGQIDISSFTDQGGGVVRITTSAAHGFETDDYVSISGTTNYDGTYQISNATGNSYFDITATYVAESGGTSKYAANIAYIGAKTSTIIWRLTSPKGTLISDRSTSVTVNSITREFTSLSSAEDLSTNVNHLNTSDLVTGNYALNLPCYYDTGADTTAVVLDGYTTGEYNYIKIYTPNNTSTEVNNLQRHQGKWDAGKYRLSLSSGNGITIQDKDVVINGLQIEITSATGDQRCVSQASGGNGGTYSISNNIMKGVLGSGYNFGVYSNADASSVSKVWNNIIYDISDGVTLGSSGIRLYYDKTPTSYLYAYNNTISGAYYGIDYSGNYMIAKNNIVQNCTDGFHEGTAFDAYSDFNISDLANDAPSASYRSNLATDVTFLDEYNNDFHLSPTDTVAKNAGTDLSSDTYLPFSTDIDGQTRSTWDIGADEAATQIFRSVGPDATSALDTGAADNNNLNISGTTGATTFSIAVPDNLGVGDAIQYDSDGNGTIDAIAFISARTNSQSFTVQSASGGTPTATSAGDQDWSIFRAYTRLSYAETGTENSSINVAVRGFDTWSGGKDIYASNEQWNIACYAHGTTADTTAVEINGWTTYPTNFIKIYTPTEETEVGISQRHQGKWDEGKYHLEISDNYTQPDGALYASESFVRIEGLQIKTDNPTLSDVTMTGIGITNLNDGSADVRVSDNIIYANLPTGLASGYGIRLGWSNDDAGKIGLVWNNIVYGFKNGTAENLSGILVYWQWENAYVYNNTVYDSYYGINSEGNIATAKNNITQNCTDGYAGTFVSGSDFNISDLANDAPSASYRNNLVTDVTFSDESNNNFHLSPTDTSAKNAGTDLSSDSYLPFSTDIDNQTRSTWDIGADEAATAIYRSVGPSATSALDTGAADNNNLNISGTTGATTFSIAVPDNVGVGDAIQYDSDGNGTIDAIAFISARTNSQSFTVQSASGGLPTATATADDQDWSIFRAYIRLSYAETGTENSSINIAVRGFDTWSGGKDIYASNEQWNIACYANGTNADTNTVTIDGWTTYPTNFIKIYTPTASTEVGTSQRHQGKWDANKYRLEYTTTGTYQWAIYTVENYVWIDGLQVLLQYSHSSTWGMSAGSISGDNSIKISNNIIRGSTSGDDLFVSGLRSSAPTNKVYAWNNIAYGFRDIDGTHGSGFTVHGSTANNEMIYYNNTAYGNAIGFYDSNYQSGIVKNNLAYNNDTDFSGSFDPLCDYNVSSDGTAPGTHSKINQTTLQFIDSANHDFHLSSTDTSAKNAGADLSADAYLAFSTDIDSQTRSTWDIGADEAANNVFYSVGQSTADLSNNGSSQTCTVGGDCTITISSGLATFNFSQTGNIGVGDRVTYNTSSIAYISSKVSATQWNLITAAGAVPGDEAVAVTLNSITHEFTTLENAIALSSNSSHINNSSLISANVVLNIPCYYDSAADTAAVTVDGYTTSASNYIKMYAPNNTSTEANTSQRHNGKWDDAKYSVAPAADDSIDVQDSHVVIDGLQLKPNMPYEGARQAVDMSNLPSNSVVQISNTIIKAGSSYVANDNGIYCPYTFGLTNATVKLWNNIIYDYDNGGKAINVSEPDFTVYAYNNTLYNNSIGINATAGTVVARNNLVKGSGDVNAYVGTFASGTDYNATDKTDPIGQGSHNETGQTFSFVNEDLDDFHLLPTDAGAKNLGEDLSADANLHFTTDIDGHTRSTWDIGADEGATSVYYSVGQNTNDHSDGGNVSITSGVATFTVAQDDANLGVGDVLTAGGYTYYLVSKNSATSWDVVTNLGAIPSDLGATAVTSIAHAYNSLFNAEAGASTLLGTSDLVTGNYQLNFPCYYDTGADTTAVTIDGYTTGASNYIKIYTPSNTSTEANVSQRHQGKWDANKYRMSLSSGNAITIRDKDVVVDGLQIEITSATGDQRCISQVSGGNGGTYSISNNIMKGVSGSGYNFGVYSDADASSVSKVWNNIIYDMNDGTYLGSSGIRLYYDKTPTSYLYVYNNTILGAYFGIDYSGNYMIAKNNIVQGCVDGFHGTETFDAFSDFNISDLANDAPSASYRSNLVTDVTFFDESADDFHLTNSETYARNSGTDLRNDAYLPFDDDIDGDSRPNGTNWDIGADETGATVEIKGGVRIDGGVKITN